MLPEMVEPWQGEFEARKPAQTCYITPDSQFPQFPGAEMWNPPNVGFFLELQIYTYTYHHFSWHILLIMEFLI